MDKNFMKGTAFGIVLVLILSLGFNSIKVIYSMLTSKASPQIKVKEIVNLIDKNFVNDVEDEKIQEGIYSGIVSSLEDKYSCYMDKDTFNEFLEMTEGSYKGMGALVFFDETKNAFVVTYIYSNSPAEKSGILVNDEITNIEGTKVTKENQEELLDIIKTSNIITLSIFRPESKENLEINITPEVIDLPTVASKMIDEETGYIRISSFDRVTLEQFETNYNQLTEKGMEKLIIDLRNNPGGLLDTVCKITDKFIPEGVITYLEYKDGKKEYHNADNVYSDIPLIVLVNENSASASEVFTGAIKDTNSGKIVGNKTYGKGVVQSLYKLRDNSGVKLTVAKYYTPKGECIHSKGIEPDYKVIQSNDVVLLSDKDLQFKKALEVIKEMN